MSRADTLRKLLAVEPLYPDEVYDVMGGDRASVAQAVKELIRAGHLTHLCSYRSRHRLTQKGMAQAFGGKPV